MIKRTVIWSSIALLYGIFWRWYTGSLRPLTTEEIEAHIGKLISRGGDPIVIERLRKFLQADTGHGFIMVNLIKLHDQPQPRPGLETAGESASAVLRRYSSRFLSTLLLRAGHPVLSGKAASEAVEVWGLDDAAAWTSVGLVRYRSRRDMIEMVNQPQFADIHPFKNAAIRKTIAVPADPIVYGGDPRLLIGLIGLIAALVLPTVRIRRN